MKRFKFLKNINKRPAHTSSTEGFSKNSFSSPFASTLTERELEVLALIVEGLSNPQIADRLIISRATAKAHVHSILQKLCVSDRTQAAVMAMREGISGTSTCSQARSKERKSVTTSPTSGSIKVATISKLKKTNRKASRRGNTASAMA